MLKNFFSFNQLRQIAFSWKANIRLLFSNQSKFRKKSIAFWLAITTVTPAAENSPTPSYVIAAYYANYSQYRPVAGQRAPFSLSSIDTDILTDLYYAFAGFGYITKSLNPSFPHLTGDFTIQPMEGNDQGTIYPALLKLKQSSKSTLRTFLSIGGWNFNNPNDPQGVGQHTYRLFSQMVSNATNRKQFIDSAIDYAHRYGFDGIDIDWEYPGDLQRGGSMDDFNNFIDFLKECSTAFSQALPPLSLSYAAAAHTPTGLPHSFQEDPNSYFRWLAQCSRYLDRITIMAYDYHTPFDNPKITGANAPLNRDTDPKSPYSIAKTLENYLNNGVPADKIVLGIPIFGHSYAKVSGLSPQERGPGKPFESPGAPGPATQTPGLLAYFEVIDIIRKGELSFGIDKVTNTCYGYDDSSGKWVSFDTPYTVKLKAQMALESHLKGIVLWTIDMDEYQQEPKYPNLRTASNVFR